MLETFFLLLVTVFVVIGIAVTLRVPGTRGYLFGPIISLIMVAVGFAAFLVVETFPIWAIVYMAAVYGGALFVVLSAVLRNGLAASLTRWRGEKWVKEIDYVYLGLGSLAVLAAINRLPQVTGRFEKVDVIAPLVLITAIVVRLIKTRAEINEWHKGTTPQGW